MSRAETQEPPALVAEPGVDVPREPRKPWKSQDWLWSAILCIVLLAGWDILVRVRGIPPLVLPGPGAVWNSLIANLRSGALFVHLGVTLSEIVAGFVLGSLFGTGLGILIALAPRLRRILSPYLIASQTMPKLALAPIFVMWFGFGLLPKVLITALIAFFPLFENTVTGLNEIDADTLELFHALRATRWQTLWLLRLPHAVPYLMAGLRVALVLSIVGAVVAEYVGANRGLGALIISSQGVMDTPLMFAVFAVLILLGVGLYQIFGVIEKRCLARRYRD